MDQNTHRPERSDSPGDRAHVYHVAGDVAEEEGQARVPLHGAGEADLLTGLTVVVADGRDGKAARVGWPRGVNGDAVGLAAPADEAQTLAHKVTLGALAAKPWGRGASRRGGRHQSSTWRLARPASTQGASGARTVSGSAWSHTSAQAIIPPEHNRRKTSRNASPRDTASAVPAARALRSLGPPAPLGTEASPPVARS